MATAEDARFARGVVRDSLVSLRWAASADGQADDGLDLVPASLKPAMARAVEEIHDGPFRQALGILDGEDPEFPPERVSATLDAVGWSGEQLAFKRQVLEEAGRREVMAATEGGPRPRRKVWKKFMAVVNAALGSLSAIPGVDTVKEIKDFSEASTAGDE
jgi:hypothetical protein